MLNNSIIIGRLTKDPEIRYTATGLTVASISVACQRDYAGSEGGQAKTDFFNVEAWRGTAEFIERYFHKGDMIVVQGRLQNDEWTDKNGNKRTTTKIVADHVYFGESKRGNQTASISATDFKELDESDGELPF